MLAPPPRNFDDIPLLPIRGAVRAVRFSHASSEDDDEQQSAPQTRCSSPLSPRVVSEVLPLSPRSCGSPSTPFKRKRRSFSGSSEEELRASLSVQLDEMRRELEEAQQRLRQVTPPPTYECSVCLEPIRQSTVGSCTHHFCHSCLLRTLHAGGVACPVCKEPIKEVRRDVEFDALLAPADAADARADPLAEFTRHLCLPPGKHAGLTLCSREGTGPGCVVLDVVRRDMAYKCGVRRGDVLISINGEPCTKPSRATELINQLSQTRSNETATLIVLPQAATVRA